MKRHFASREKEKIFLWVLMNGCILSPVSRAVCPLRDQSANGLRGWEGRSMILLVFGPTVTNNAVTKEKSELRSQVSYLNDHMSFLKGQQRGASITYLGRQRLRKSSSGVLVDHAKHLDVRVADTPLVRRDWRAFFVQANLY